MPLLSPYRHALSSQQIINRLLWLFGTDDSAKRWIASPLGHALACDRLLYHFASYLLVSATLSHSELGMLVEHSLNYGHLLHRLKLLIRQSIADVQLKHVCLGVPEAWRVALLHNVSYALEQSHEVAYDLPFDQMLIATWQLRLVHAQPCITAWGTPEERWLWIEEVETTLSQWPADFIEEEHPSNGNIAMLGRETKEAPYTYISLTELLQEVRHVLATRDITDAYFVSLYNRVSRLGGAYAARPLANAALLPVDALWSTLQQHRIFALRAKCWLQDGNYLPPCTRLLLTKGYTRAERPYFHWSQHDRKRYLEAMQCSIDTLCS